VSQGCEAATTLETNRKTINGTSVGSALSQTATGLLLKITAWRCMSPITWTAQTRRRWPRDDPGQNHIKQEMMHVTVQHRASIARRREDNDPSYLHRLFRARSSSRAAKKVSAADEAASGIGAAFLVGTAAADALEGAGDCVATAEGISPF